MIQKVLSQYCGKRKHYIVSTSGSVEEDYSDPGHLSNGLELEISSVNGGVILRAAKEDLEVCDDYAGFVLNPDESVKAIVIADGASQSFAAEIASYYTVTRLIDQLRNFNGTFNAQTIPDFLSEISKTNDLTLENVLALSGNGNASRRVSRRIAQDGVIGSTTFFGAFKDDSGLHIFGLGDCMGVLSYEGAMHSFGRSYPGSIPPQLAYRPNTVNGWDNGDLLHQFFKCDSPVKLAIITDGCLKYGGTLEHIGLFLENNPINVGSGLKLFEGLLKGSRELYDDATLALVEFL